MRWVDGDEENDVVFVLIYLLQAADGIESVDSEATDKIASGDPSSMSATIIDMDIFGQLLEMDDEEDREFSKEIVWNYFDQAETTFGKMDAALYVRLCPSALHSFTDLAPFCTSHRAEKDLPELSTLGHFLKGSSAAVGVIKVRDSCEYMQHYGKKADKDGITTLSGEEALKKLQTTLQDVKVEYKEAEAALRKFYADSE